MGAAWYEPEHRRLGIDFPSVGERFDLLEDQLEIATRLFTGKMVSYRGKRVSLADAQLQPVPVQRPRPPIWVGGSGRKRTLPLVARYADVWHTNRLGSYRELSAELDRLAEQAGRDPRSIRRAASLSLSESLEEVRANAERLVGNGVDYIICSWPGQGKQRVEEFWTSVAPRLQDVA